MYSVVGRTSSSPLPILKGTPPAALLLVRFNIAKAARRLGVRRQSIYYRLEQLRGMLGELESPEKRFAIWLALELLKRQGSPVSEETKLP